MLYALVVEGLLTWYSNLQIAKLMTCRVHKQIIRWVENCLDYQAQRGDQQHKVQAGSWLSVESLKDQHWCQYYLVFLLIKG